MFDLRTAFIIVMDEIFPILSNDTNNLVENGRPNNPLEKAKLFIANSIVQLEMHFGTNVEDLTKMQASDFLSKFHSKVRSELNILDWSVYRQNISAELSAIEQYIDSICIHQAQVFLIEVKKLESARIATSNSKVGVPALNAA